MFEQTVEGTASQKSQFDTPIEVKVLEQRSLEIDKTDLLSAENSIDVYGQQPILLELDGLHLLQVAIQYYEVPRPAQPEVKVLTISQVGLRGAQLH